MIDQFIAYLEAIPPALAYTVIAGLVFAEAAVFVGFVLPGETAVLIGGVMASAGQLSLWVLLPLVAVAAILGDSVGFEVGRYLGPRLVELRVIQPHRSRVEQAQEYLRRRGGRAVVLGRWTAFLRAVMPALAGASHMHYRRFLAFNAFGGIVWAVVVVMGGYFAGASYDKVAGWLGRTSAIILAVIVVAVVIGWHRHRRQQHREPADGG